jgi:hypothetical protein
MTELDLLNARPSLGTKEFVLAIEQNIHEIEGLILRMEPIKMERGSSIVLKVSLLI